MPASEYKQKVRITVLGSKNSGKTSFVYRYLARISLKNDEKASNTTPYDNIYNHCVCLDHVLFDLEIVDLGHPNNGAKFEKSSDAFIVVYSLTAKADFEEATGTCQRLKLMYPRKPVLLVGNKVDLEREVDLGEGHRLNGELSVELSSAHDNSWEVHQAMYLLLRKVSEIYQLPVLLKALKAQSMVKGDYEDSLKMSSV
ncbi:ras-like protein family member 12 [Galendromus occidentalis]|uniref:small monomeric GTPase n=1 Tax=Galendromus occidentalis TaxID=34638 RepID=A0AAJ6VX10_9ACAR|nr:ras-like protein family member 12 [Galendromus occidentalis]